MILLIPTPATPTGPVAPATPGGPGGPERAPAVVPFTSHGVSKQHISTAMADLPSRFS